MSLWRSRPERIEPGPGQESVWDYPRPPRLVRCNDEIVVRHAGVEIARTTGAFRVLETSQPPAFYLPPGDVARELLVAASGRSMCEWKGLASYWSVAVPGAPIAADAGWSYEQPTAPFAGIAGYLAFYAQRLDECWVGDEQVVANPGSFYGGWITPRVVGPFKGDPGTLHW
jgi:uncharacterized protein (DUF427 family)